LDEFPAPMPTHHFPLLEDGANRAPVPSPRLRVFGERARVRGPLELPGLSCRHQFAVLIGNNDLNIVSKPVIFLYNGFLALAAGVVCPESPCAAAAPKTRFPRRNPVVKWRLRNTKQCGCPSSNPHRRTFSCTAPISGCRSRN
jgi:hypothetical protein